MSSAAYSRISRGIRSNGGLPSFTTAAASYGTVFRYDSGYPTKYTWGDSWLTTWADDDQLYTSADDTNGWQNTTGCCGATSSNLNISTLSGYTTSTTGVLVNQMAQFGTEAQQGSDSRAFKTNGLISVGGVLYDFVSRHAYTTGTPPYQQTTCCQQIIKSSDHGVSWTPLPPSTAQPYASPMFPGTTFSVSTPVQYGKDYQGSGPDNSGNYLYAFSNEGCWNNCSTMFLGRVSLANLPNLNGANWEYYQGGDGNISGNWGAWGTAQAILNEAYHVSGFVGAQYFPALFGSGGGGYVMLQWYYGPPGPPGTFNSTYTSWVLYTAHQPWGPWTKWNTFLWNGTGVPSDFGKYTPQIVSKSVQQTSNVATAMIFASGDFNAPYDPMNTPYTLTLIPLTITMN